MAEHNQQFASFTEWVNKASSWLTRHPQFQEGGAAPFRAVCFDSKGRLCRIGADFMRARDDGSFPVHWIWPDQVGPIVLEGQELVKQVNALGKACGVVSESAAA